MSTVKKLKQRKPLGLFSRTALVVGNIIGSGILPIYITLTKNTIQERANDR